MTIIVFAIFVGVLFVKSFSYDLYMAKKDSEVEKMKSVNKYFDEEVKGVNIKLQKINEYLLSITGEIDENAIEDHNFHAPEEFVEDEEHLSNRSDRGGTEPHQLTPTERSLPKQNTELPCEPATPSPAVTSYTNEYLADLKKA